MNVKFLFFRNILKNTQTKSSNGFTLIELLVCLIIVGVLSSIALVTYVVQIEKTKFLEVELNLKTCKKFQIAFYVEKMRFAETIDSLGMNHESNNFSYEVDTLTLDTEQGLIQTTCCLGVPKDIQEGVMPIWTECLSEKQI